MATKTSVKQFKANPVEVVIFLAVTGMFSNSLYRLFYDTPDFQPAALSKMAANPISEGRSPASVDAPSFKNIDVRCNSTSDYDTDANKVRLIGPLCGVDEGNDSSKHIKTVVFNQANKFNASVFTDITAGKFSTDYIPLNQGKNPIRMEFTFRGGKVVTRDFNIQKN